MYMCMYMQVQKAGPFGKCFKCSGIESTIILTSKAILGCNRKAKDFDLRKKEKELKGLKI